MAEQGQTRRLSAILIITHEATVETLITYRRIFTHLIEQYRGRVVDAVNCGVEMQRALAERNAELPENRRMPFRIGINLGDVLEEGGRICGDGVNVASRMEGLAEAGEICISGTVYDDIKTRSAWNTSSWVNTKTRKAKNFERYSKL